MTMRLADLVKEMETVAAQVELGDLHGAVGGYDRVAAFSVTANLDDKGNVSAGVTGSPAATVTFQIMKLLEEVRR